MHDSQSGTTKLTESLEAGLIGIDNDDGEWPARIALVESEIKQRIAEGSVSNATWKKLEVL
jgi:hypothetical protein